jgi:hypothetical protein
MRISPVSFVPIRSIVVLPQNVKLEKQDTAIAGDVANFTKEVEIGDDGSVTSYERTKEGVLKRVDTKYPDGAEVFEEYEHDGKTVLRRGVFANDRHGVITMYYPGGKNRQNVAKINPSGTSTSAKYSPDGKLTSKTKTRKDGSKIIFEFPQNGGRKITQANKYGDRTETYFDVQNNPKYEFEISGGNLLRTRIYEPLGDYTETKFLEDGSFENTRGRAEQVQIASTTIYNNTDGTRDFVIKNPDGSLTLEPCDSDGIPTDTAEEYQGE